MSRKAQSRAPATWDTGDLESAVNIESGPNTRRTRLWDRERYLNAEGAINERRLIAHRAHGISSYTVCSDLSSSSPS
jgi:hypothetical protein